MANLCPPGIIVHVDKRITLAAFKQNMEPFVGVGSSQFKVFRVYANNQEFESVRLNETLSSFSDDNKVCILRVDPVSHCVCLVNLSEGTDSDDDEGCEFYTMQITIRLGRALKKGEYRVKVYQLLVNEAEVCNS